MDKMIMDKEKSFKEKQILEITWMDSVSSNGWVFKTNYNKDPNENFINHKSIGYFLQGDEDSITIMQSYACQEFKDGDYQTAERLLIPKKCIIKMRVIM